MAVSGRLRLVAALVAASGTQAFAFAIAAFLATKVLPVDDRGVMVVALTVATLLAPIASMGTANSLRSRLPRADQEQARDLVVSYTRISVWSGVLGAAVASATCIPLSTFTDSSLRAPAILIAVFLGAFSLICAQQLTEAWFASGRFRAGARWSAAAALGGLVGTAVGYLAHNSAAVLMIGQSLGIFTVSASAFRMAKRDGVVSWSGSRPTRIRSLVRHGIQSIGMPIGTSLVLRSDRLILAAVSNSKTVAVYALAATVAEAVRLAPTAAAQLVTRDVAEMRVRHSIFRSQFSGLLAVTVVGLPLLFLAHTFFVPLFGDAYAESAALLNILMLAEVGFSLFIISQRGLIGGGWNWDVTAIGILGGLSAIPVYVIGATINGAAGCAWGGVVLYTMIGLAGSFAFYRRIRSAAYLKTMEAGGDQR